MEQKIYQDITELVGNTPLLGLKTIENELGLKARLVAKIEFFNPGGSVKDRIALAMIEDAERKGTLKPGGTIIEPTSGNTGVGLAMVAAAKGYRAIIVMPETMSEERRRIIKAYGAELVLTPGSEGMKGSIAKAKEILAETDNAIIPMQFDNPANTAIHEVTTACEIWEATNGQVDVVVAGTGTGGTISGIAHTLKAKKSGLKAFTVEPAASPVLAGGQPAPHKIQGIAPGFIPGNYDAKAVDGIIAVENEEAFEAARLIARKQGVLVGISSGAALHAAINLAKQDEYAGKTIVVILPDTGERYLSTELFK